MNLLVAAYVRRKKWEAKLQATAVLNALGQAMGGTATKEGNADRRVAGYREISPEEMLQRIR